MAHQQWMDAFTRAAWLWADECGHCSTFDSIAHAARMRRRSDRVYVEAREVGSRVRLTHTVSRWDQGCICPQARYLANRSLQQRGRPSAGEWELEGCLAEQHDAGVAQLTSMALPTAVTAPSPSEPLGRLVRRKRGQPALLVRERDGQATTLNRSGMHLVPTDGLTYLHGPITPAMAQVAQQTADRLTQRAKAMTFALEGERHKRHTTVLLITRAAHSKGDQFNCDKRLDELLTRFGLVPRALRLRRTVRARITITAPSTSFSYLIPGSVVETGIVTSQVVTDLVDNGPGVMACDCETFDAMAWVKEQTTPSPRGRSVTVHEAASIGLTNQRGGNVCQHEVVMEAVPSWTT